MKPSLCPRIFCCLFAAAICTVSDGRAQIVVNQQAGISTEAAPPLFSAQIGMVSTGGMVLGSQENAEVVKGQPYQAQALTEMKQTLADGSHFVQSLRATVARDSEGRTVRIQKLSTIGPWRSTASSEGNGPTLTTIFDPVAKEHIDYTSDMKVAHKMNMSTLPAGIVTATSGGFSVAAAGPGTAGAGIAFSIQGPVNSSQAGVQPQIKTEVLGTKTIDGIQADGTRATSAIPAGTIGNDKDLTIGRETWYSPELKLVLLSTQDDPRFGQTTYSLKNVQQNEPDPTLFQVPSGYRVEELPAPPQPR
jgi:hypothetical protein